MQVLHVYAQGEQNEQLTELNILVSASMLLTMRFYCLRVCAKPINDIQCNSDFKLLVALYFQVSVDLLVFYMVCIKIPSVYFRLFFVDYRKF